MHADLMFPTQENSEFMRVSNREKGMQKRKRRFHIASYASAHSYNWFIADVKKLVYYQTF